MVSLSQTSSISVAIWFLGVIGEIGRCTGLQKCQISAEVDFLSTDFRGEVNERHSMRELSLMLPNSGGTQAIDSINDIYVRVLFYVLFDSNLEANECIMCVIFRDFIRCGVVYFIPEPPERRNRFPDVRRYSVLRVI